MASNVGLNDFVVAVAQYEDKNNGTCGIIFKSYKQPSTIAQKYEQQIYHSKLRFSTEKIAGKGS